MQRRAMNGRNGQKNPRQAAEWEPFIQRLDLLSYDAAYIVHALLGAFTH